MPKKTTPAKVQFATQNINDIEHERSPHFRSIYSNNVRLSLTPYEFRMTFVNLTEGLGPGKFVMEEEATIVMGPVQLKTFASGLANAIATYEAQFGTIPPGVGAELKSKSKH